MDGFRIGLITGNKSDEYNHSLRLGVQNTLEAAGTTLITIADLIPYHTDANTENYLRVAFELAGRLNLDTVIVPLGVVNGYLSGDDALAYEMLEVLDRSKTLVLGRKLPGYRCILNDNKPGMYECMRHLIETCGFRRIAFVSGPETSVGARERETVYFEEMAAHGLEVPRDYFVRGRFSGNCRPVIEKLVDEHPELEAIACAADLIAFTTYEVLRARRLEIGHDIAVTGYDDQPKAAHIDPPLSTVHMTAYDFGCMAGREALRMCQGLAQEETVIPSTFIVRNSCGENLETGLMRCRDLIRQRPLPADEIVDLLVESTLNLAGPKVAADFRVQCAAFFDKVRRAYVAHHNDPHMYDSLYSSQDIAALFSGKHRAYLSAEGFHAVAITLLEALLAESPKEDVSWVVQQISQLHLHVARMLNDTMQGDLRAMNVREWVTVHITEDSLADADRPQEAYKLMLGELAKLGVSKADLFLLPESVTSMGGKAFAMSDALHHIGMLRDHGVEVFERPHVVTLQGLVGHVLPVYAHADSCTIGGIMAGNELMGVLTMDPGTLDDNGQLMAMLNAGLACKYLQMLATEREMNELLSKNNLLLERQSQRDEMTGLLNRRGLSDGMLHVLRENPTDLAVLMYLDLDGLKFINDSLGHDAGDDAIRTTAEVLRRTLPTKCLIARMGGDEFVVFTRIGEAAEASMLDEAVQRGVDDRNACGDLPFELSISCGHKCFCGGDDPTEAVTDAMVHADECMYAMKRSRRQSRRFHE